MIDTEARTSIYVSFLEYYFLDLKSVTCVDFGAQSTELHLTCLGSIEFVEPDLAGLLPISPPPDTGDKRESASAVNERPKKDGGGERVYS